MYPLSNQRADYGNNGVISQKSPNYSVLLDATVHLSHTSHGAEHHGREDKQGTQREKVSSPEKPTQTVLLVHTDQNAEHLGREDK